MGVIRGKRVGKESSPPPQLQDDEMGYAVQKTAPFAAAAVRNGSGCWII